MSLSAHHTAPPTQVAVIGGGSWGTTIASLIATKTPTRLWCRRAEIAEEINEDSTNGQYLPGFSLTPGIVASVDMAQTLSEADVVAMAVPSHVFRGVMRKVAGHLQAGIPVVSFSKGLEQVTHRRMTEIVLEESPFSQAGVLTGPNLAREVLAGESAAAVLAMQDTGLAKVLQPLFSTEAFRVYVTDDVIGCELAGALKNVVAMVVGMADGLGISDNTRAAIITRGLEELTRLGVAMGGDPATFAGLAGLGDLLATCLSPHSRNHFVGEQLGRGRKLDEILDSMTQVAEGPRTTGAVMELAEEHDVYVPIAAELQAVLDGERSAGVAYRHLWGELSAQDWGEQPVARPSGR